jgi:protein-tyrosine phosphatase
MDENHQKRHISPLTGAFNFRDLGGLATRDGRVTQRGRLYRSDTLQALTPEDVIQLTAQFGVEAIVDLRLPDEVADEGRGPLASFVGIRHINTPLDMASIDNLRPEEVLNALYLSSLEPGSMLPMAVEHLASLAGRPTVFHCAAGKDRTGLLAAVVLRLVGVDDELIVADYMDSAHNMPRIMERFASWPRYRDHQAQMPPQVYAVEEPPIRLFLAELDKRYGSARAWASSHGIGPEALATLERGLLTAR